MLWKRERRKQDVVTAVADSAPSASLGESSLVAKVMTAVDGSTEVYSGGSGESDRRSERR